MVSVSVCQAGCPGSSPARSVCFRKIKFCQKVINLSLPVPTTGSPKAAHVSSCLCDNACKRCLLSVTRVGHRVPLAAFCLSLYGLHVLHWDVNKIQSNKQNYTISHTFQAQSARFCKSQACFGILKKTSVLYTKPG